MHQRLEPIRWLFLDPSVLLNENDTEREARRLLATALGQRGQFVEQEQVERAWMQAIASTRPVHPLIGAAQHLAPSSAAAAAIADEVIRTTRNLDTLYSGVHLALNVLQARFRVGIIGPYRLPGTRAKLDKFHLSFQVMALSDEQHLSEKLDAYGRPEPSLFVWALHKAGIPAREAAFASDRVDLGLAPAKTAGMTTFWLRLTNHKLRYPRNEAERPDLTLNSLNELAQLVTQEPAI